MEMDIAVTEAEMQGIEQQLNRLQELEALQDNWEVQAQAKDELSGTRNAPGPWSGGPSRGQGRGESLLARVPGLEVQAEARDEVPGLEVQAEARDEVPGLEVQAEARDEVSHYLHRPLAWRSKQRPGTSAEIDMFGISPGQPLG
eukprot:gene30455-35465_t